MAHAQTSTMKGGGGLRFMAVEDLFIKYEIVVLHSPDIHRKKDKKKCKKKKYIQDFYIQYCIYKKKKSAKVP